jgi:hypothetical protein
MINFLTLWWHKYPHHFPWWSENIRAEIWTRRKHCPMCWEHTIYWLVVDLPLWKILVTWDYSSQYIKKKCSKPPTIQWETEFFNVGFRKPLEKPGSASHPAHSFQLCFVLGLLLLEYQDSTGLDSSWKAQPCEWFTRGLFFIFRVCPTV